MNEEAQPCVDERGTATLLQVDQVRDPPLGLPNAKRSSEGPADAQKCACCAAVYDMSKRTQQDAKLCANWTFATLERRIIVCGVASYFWTDKNRSEISSAFA